MGLELTLLRFLLSAVFLSSLVACGNGGHVEFNPDFLKALEKPAGFNLVPASRALATGNGYSAKLQLNPVSGTKLQAGNGYSASLKYTVRNR